MKKSIALAALLLILLPIGFILPQPEIGGKLLAAKIIPASFYLQTNTFPIIQEINQSPAYIPENNYSLQINPLGNAPVDLYGLLELDLKTNLQVTNPYDPNNLDLRVSFNAPSGREVQVGAFWYQGFDFQTRMPSGEPGWKVRFTPDEVGEWMAVAYAPALGVHSTPLSFIVRPSYHPGFIRINPKNPLYLAYDDGSFFFPIGVNMAWWSEYQDPIAQYDKWLKAFSANGGNTIRVWMASWSFGIEWKDTGLGNYHDRQYQAQLLDQLFQLAEKYRVKIILVLINHGALSLDSNSEWQDNPYNATLGGPLKSPEQFVNDPAAKTYFQQRLNYIINRWGYSPELLAWEWFNEVNLTPISDAALLPWLAEMTDFLKSRDVNHHLTTSSFAMRTKSIIWQLPGLDIVQTHEYSSQIGENGYDLAGRAIQDFQDLAASVPPKPILMGELGYSAKNYGEDIETTGIHLHNGLWATTFSGYAGSAMYWWWDIYIDPNNLWHQFKGLADFLNGEDLSAYQPISPLQINGPEETGGQAVGLGLRGKNILVWLHNNDYTVQASVAAREGKPDSTFYIPPLVEGLSLKLKELSNGSYTVRWFDPQIGQWLDEQVVSVKYNTLLIPIPAFREDLAARIIHNP